MVETKLQHTCLSNPTATSDGCVRACATFPNLPAYLYPLPVHPKPPPSFPPHSPQKQNPSTMATSCSARSRIACRLLGTTR